MTAPTPIPSHLSHPTTPDAGDSFEEPGNWRLLFEVARRIVERIQEQQRERGNVA